MLKVYKITIISAAASNCS